MTSFARHRDYYAGALVALIGAGAILEGRTYGIGTLTDMGSGFFPVALGAGLILMGILMAAVHSPAPDAHQATRPIGAAPPPSPPPSACSSRSPTRWAWRRPPSPASSSARSALGDHAEGGRRSSPSA